MTNRGYTVYQGAKLCYDIANGNFDAEINSLATFLNQYPDVQYLLRPDYEVSGNLHANTNEATFDPPSFDYDAYPAAYRHIHELIGGQVSNVAFMYHPVRGSAEALWPGDDVVDYQGKSTSSCQVDVSD